MNDVEVKQIINDTVSETVIKLKKMSLMNESKMSAYRKTEELLKNYTRWKDIESKQTKKLVQILDRELDILSDDPYFEVIPMIYFNSMTYEDVAEQFNVSARTIMRNKIRLINKLKIVLFSDDVITEIFL